MVEPRRLSGASVSINSAPRLPPLHPTIQDISLGSTEEDVIRIFGQPIRRDLKPADPKDDPLGMGDLLELQYPGLRLELNKPPGQQTFTICQWTLTGDQWGVAPGIRLTMTPDEITKVLGRTPEITNQDDDTTRRYWYPLNDPSCDCGFYLRVKDGKVIERVMLEDGS